jgi:hypothetical protein
MPTQNEIDDVLDQCSHEGRSKFPGLSYEHGVRAAIEWMQGEGSNPMDD